MTTIHPRPDAPDGLQERPFGYDGPIYTLSQVKAYGRQCAAYEKQKQEATIKRLRDRLEAATVAVEKMRDVARAFLSNKNPGA